MTVTDATNETAVVNHTIRVNSPPNAAFQHSPSNPTIGAERQLRRLRLDRRRGAFRRRLRLGPRQRRCLRRRGTGARSTTASSITRRQHRAAYRSRTRRASKSTTSDSVVVEAGQHRSRTRRSGSPRERPNPNQSVTFNAGRHDGRRAPSSHRLRVGPRRRRPFGDALGITPTTSLRVRHEDRVRSGSPTRSAHSDTDVADRHGERPALRVLHSRARPAPT